MTSALKAYQRHLRKQLVPNAFAVWPPGRALQLGDVVEFERGGGLSKQTDLQQLGLELTIQHGQAQSMSATSNRVRDAMARAEIGASVGPSGDVDLELHGKGSVIFEVRGFQHLQISNLADIRKSLLKLYGEENWKTSWYLVDQIWWVDTGTIIVSEDDKTTVTVAAEGGKILDALADPKVKANVDVRGGSATKLIRGRSFCAMFTGTRLGWRNRLFRSAGPHTTSPPLSPPDWHVLTLNEVEELLGFDDD